MVSTRWFPRTPDPDAPGSALLIRLIELLDRLEPMQLDGDRSEATWTRGRNLSVVEVVLRHRTERALSLSFGLGDGGGTFYGQQGVEEFDDDQTGPDGIFAEVELQLRQSYLIEDTFRKERLLRTVVRSPGSTGVTGLLSPVAAVVPDHYLRIERRQADYGCLH